MLPFRVPPVHFAPVPYHALAPNATALVAQAVAHPAYVPDQVAPASADSSPDRAVPRSPLRHLRAGRRFLCVRPLATLQRDRLRVTHRRGTGPGRHAYWRTFRGPPFPMQGGCVVAFDVRFEKGFEWGCRGKVGGLSVGPGRSSGGERSRDGASFRLMWDSDGSAYGYAYVPRGSEDMQPPELGRRAEYGLDVLKDRFRGVFRDGKWHRVELGVRLNGVSGGRPRADGELMLGVDGRSHRLKRVVWRLSEDVDVEAFTLGMFHGGPCKATRTSFSNVRNVVVYRW